MKLLYKSESQTGFGFFFLYILFTLSSNAFWKEMCGLSPKSKVKGFGGFITEIRRCNWTDIRTAILSIAPGMKWALSYCMKGLVVMDSRELFPFICRLPADDLCFAMAVNRKWATVFRKTWYFRTWLTIAKSLGLMVEFYKMIRTKFVNLAISNTFHSFWSSVGHAP
jgi:hypothetical protein